MTQQQHVTTILLIDHDPATRAAAARLLQAASYATLEAEDEPTGLRLARERPPALILLGPGWSPEAGLALLERLRAEATTRYIPVLALGAATTPSDQPLLRADARRGGFDPARLLEHIERLVALAPAPGR